MWNSRSRSCFIACFTFWSFVTPQQTPHLGWVAESLACSLPCVYTYELILTFPWLQRWHPGLSCQAETSEGYEGHRCSPSVGFWLLEIKMQNEKTGDTGPTATQRWVLSPHPLSTDLLTQNHLFNFQRTEAQASVAPGHRLDPSRTKLLGLNAGNARHQNF